VLGIVLPVGISFYTFLTLSYTIDICRGTLSPTRSFLDFALFVSFFPQLVAGPIERARQLLPQIQRPRTVDRGRFDSGCWLVLAGLFKKVVVADNLAAAAPLAGVRRDLPGHRRPG
jgi:alginate O-acetyltransferase complex protein AlgI